MSKEHKSWQHLGTKVLQETWIFDLCAKRMRSPDGSYEGDFYYLDSVDWVNIIPITEDRQVVLVKQHRHGVNQLSLEIPGGVLDSREEDPQKAAVRELEEETGYSSGKVVSLGSVHPNPAIQNNCCHCFLSTGVSLSGAQNLDPAEDISVHLAPLEEIPQLIAKGEISHTLVVSAFLRFAIHHGEEFGWSLHL